MNKELKRLLQEQREKDDYHLSMETEFDFYRKIANGDIDGINGRVGNAADEGMGKLSLNPVCNERYHTIIMIAMVTRFCIEAGLDSEEAFTLSDMYVRKIDECNDVMLIRRIRSQAVQEFTLTMKNLQASDITNLQVKRGVDYVAKNLTRAISSMDVGNAIGCNPDYLSRLFKKELGLTLGDYILKRKCMAACYMLENSNESVTDIAVFLGFSSTSHFIERFKKMMKESPEKYRNRVSFSNNI